MLRILEHQNKILFKSQDLCDLVKNWYLDPDEEAKSKENKKRGFQNIIFHPASRI